MRRAFSLLGLILWALAALLPLHESSRVLASEFSVVAPGDPLHKQLQLVRSAGWSSLGTATSASRTPVALTRYEIALEAAKALIAVRARHDASENWARTASPEALRALRALSVELKTELAAFEVNIPATLRLLDELIGRASNTPLPTTAAASTPVLEFRSEPRTRRDSPASRREFEEPSLAQRFRVHSALDSLARSAHDPYASQRGNENIFTARNANGFDATSPAGVKKLRAGAAFDVNRRLRLRADFEREASDGVPTRAPGLREFLSGAATDSPLGTTRELGAGADVMLRRGIVLSGGVARVDTTSPFGSGLRYEGELGLNGWQNRVALTAHLSRLVPEDSLALGVTAARLNLGVDLTSQVQLTLMYQQLFGASAATQSSHRFGGGIDFNF